MRLKELAEIPEEDLKDLKQLATLRKLNANPSWRNTDIYRLLYRRGLHIVAYQSIRSKPGNMTSGADAATLDGYSLKEIDRTISQLRDESYQPKPVRMSFIPKANGKLRKLGIPSPLERYSKT